MIDDPVAALRVAIVVALALETIGITLAVLLLADAKKDLEVIVREHVENGRRIIATSSVKTETYRLLTLVSLLVTSILLVHTLWHIPIDRISNARMASVISLDMAVLFVIAQSITVYRVRRKLFEGYRDSILSNEDLNGI